jgi:hypothetical protein
MKLLHSSATAMIAMTMDTSNETQISCREPVCA